MMGENPPLRFLNCETITGTAILKFSFGSETISVPFSIAIPPFAPGPDLADMKQERCGPMIVCSFQKQISSLAMGDGGFVMGALGSCCLQWLDQPVWLLSFNPCVEFNEAFRAA